MRRPAGAERDHVLVTSDEPLAAVEAIERCLGAGADPHLGIPDELVLAAAGIVRIARESRSAMAAEWVVAVRLKRLLARAAGEP